jgi:hypothetical protein
LEPRRVRRRTSHNGLGLSGTPFSGVGRVAGSRVCVLCVGLSGFMASLLAFSLVLDASLPSAGAQASRIKTSARFMFIAMAMSCKWQALRARPR